MIIGVCGFPSVYMKYSCYRLKKPKEMRKRVGIVKQEKDFTKGTGVTKLVRSVLLPMRTWVRARTVFLLPADCETERALEQTGNDRWEGEHFVQPLLEFFLCCVSARNGGGCSLSWSAGVLLPQMR